MKKRTAKVAPRVKVKPSPVEVRYRAHPGIWSTALRLAKGDPSRLEVVSWSEVHVLPPR